MCRLVRYFVIRVQAVWRTSRSSKSVFAFVDPGHLDGFENFLVRFRGIVFEPFKLSDPFMQVGEAKVEVILVRMGFLKLDRDVLNVCPTVLSKLGTTMSCLDFVEASALHV